MRGTLSVAGYLSTGGSGGPKRVSALDGGMTESLSPWAQASGSQAWAGARG